MNKKIVGVAQSLGLEVNGNMAYGHVDGYELNILYVPMNSFPIVLQFSGHILEDKRDAIATEIKKLALKNCQYQFNDFGLILALTGLTLGSITSKLNDIISKIINTLKENDVQGDSYCPICGKELTDENSKLCSVDCLNVKICLDCLNSINEQIEKNNAEIDKAPNNYFKGTIGAIVGGLCGSLVAVILSMLGFISGISALVAVVLGFLLYQKFGGKANKQMVFIVSATSVLCMVLAVFFIYLVAAKAFAAEMGFTAETSLALFNKAMSYSEFSSSFIRDLIMSLLFAVLGGVFEIKKMANSVKPTEKIK